MARVAYIAQNTDLETLPTGNCQSQVRLFNFTHWDINGWKLIQYLKKVMEWKKRIPWD